MDKKAPVSLQLGDSRGSNKAATNHYFNDQAAKFFAAKRSPRTTSAGVTSARTRRSPDC